MLDRLLDALIPARRRNRRLVQENRRLESFLRAVPIEYCGWDSTGTQAISPGFCAMLGIDKVGSIEDVEAAITAGDAAALEGLFDRLQQQGDSFEIGVNTVASRKTLKIYGRRGALQGTAQPFSVIWLYDITDFAQAAMRSMEAVTAVEKRENELRSALNALPFPVWTRNHKLELTWCNRFYSRMVDDSTAAVIAEQKELPMTGAGKSDVGQRALAQKAVAQQAAQAARAHTVIEGQRRLIEIIEMPFGADKRLVGAALDVTREEEWESSYKWLVASHKESLEQLRTAIAMFDADLRLEFYNSAYEQLTGMPGVWLDTYPRLGEIIDKLRELRKLPEQADYKQFKQGWINKFTAQLEPYEEMQYLPDGTVLRMIVVPRPMGGSLLTLEDVTSRLQLETSFNTLMAVQQETIDNLAEGIAVFGEDGRLKLSNQSFAKMWNLQPEDLSGTVHISKLVEKMKGLFGEKIRAEARNTLLGNGLERAPRRGRLQLGSGAILEYSVVPLPDGNILNAYSDITDTVKVEQALLEKNAALEEAERLKTNFLANVSYQLRTPLNTMMGFAEMLHQQYFGKLNERQMEYTTSMIEAGQRLVSLINDILDLSTIEAGYLKLTPSEINVRELIGRVAILTEEWAHKQKLEIVIQCKDPALTIVADERRLKQVLLNLISNAFNYSPHGGKITLSAERAGDSVILGIRDTGIGIPAADIERIFTPFDKITSRKVQKRSGAGLGLTLVKNIVELHGGEVTIESREGHGTFVACRLPLRMAMAEKLPAA
jgi:signal transduction histidine kinase